jgi:D-alanyl-D-alanine carboxypeptidase-like protein
VRRLLCGVLLAALVAGCSDSSPGEAETPRAEPTSTPSSPSPSASEDAGPSYSAWELGAQPLRLRPDGLGEIRPTPPSLRERRYPTADVLPPPPDGGFQATVGPVTPRIRARSTWSLACPVALDDLRYLTVSFRGFDGAAHTGELMVAASEADGIVSVFRALYAARFPIEEMRIPTRRDLDAHPTGDGNNTGAFVCRPTVGATSWSAHAYGLAIDVNPFMNPYQRDDVVLPELASSYLRRDWRRPGMFGPDSMVVREFARIGWSWGGAWRTLKDYQHFSATGR